MHVEQEKRRPRRGTYLLPNMLTTLSMFLGFLAIVWAGQGRFEPACLAVLGSGLMDGLDGKVARLTNTASPFGLQYDSLSDSVAFGLSPALILWLWQLHGFGRLGVACAFIYAACGALRLARFNISTAAVGKRFFMGLPIPAGGCTLATFVFFAPLVPEPFAWTVPYLALVLTVCLALLMVSRVRYFAFKEFDFLRAHPVRAMVGFLFLLGLIVSQPRLFGFLFCLAYILGGLVYTYVLLPRRESLLERPLSPER